MKPVVVHVRATNFLGGPERQILGHARVSGDAWYETVVASFSEGRERVEFLEAARAQGTRTVVLRSGGPFDPRPLRELAQFAQREPVAAFVAHGYKSAAVCDLVSRAVGRPWLGAVRGFTGENRRVRSFEAVEMRLLRDARLVIAVSQGTAEMLAGRGIPPERIRVVPNSVEVDEWRGAPADRGASGAAEERYWVFSGRLSPEKNVSGLLHAVAARPGGARLVIAGAGALREALEQEARELGVAHRVHFAGFQKDIRALYAGALGLVLPSLREGLPNAVLEALSAGLPVVATRVGGVPEVVRDGETGLLVEPGDVDALAAAMGRVESDPAWAARLARQGREHLRRHFGFESQRQHWDAALAEVVRGGPRVAVPIRERLKAGVKERLGATSRTTDRSPVVLTFHRVVDLEDPLEVSATCPWISLRTFEALLDRITREFEVVPLPAILKSPGRGRTRLALTFDDGWADNLQLAAPALAARGLPWAVFPATAYAGTDRRHWQDRLWEGALALFRSGEGMPAVWRGVWPAEPARSRMELAGRCQAVVAQLKRWEPERRDELLAALPEPPGGPPRYLGPQELRALDREGVLVGSHTHQHVLLARAGEARVRAELSESAEHLAEWLGHRPAAVAYPDGSVTPRVAALAREAGYRIGLTTREGRVDRDANPLLLPRVDMTEERLLGADARFTYDRFRFELSRVP